MEPKDFSRFAGRTREEVAQKLAEEDKEQLDASLAPIRARIAREERGRKAEEQRRVEAQEQARRDKARAELDAERERRLRIWQVNGGSKESFAKAWPDMERRILEEKLAALDRKSAEGSIF